MLVRELMTPNPITISPDMAVSEALDLMHEHHFRRLPVLNPQKRLIGIVSEKDLMHASPSPATSLDVWEVRDLLTKVTVDIVMTRAVVTVDESTPAEEAARLMIDSNIGSLPVMRGSKLVGIITVKDLLQVFVLLLGGRRDGLRMAALTSNEKGTVAKITQAIFAAGGSLVGLGLNEVETQNNAHWQLTCKVQGITLEELDAAVRPLVVKVLDLREI
jgi:acetoin utilization protein AcuB